MKNAFHFMLKKPYLIRKLWFTSKISTSRTGQQIITIHILPNISRSNDNHAMKFGQLIKYSVRNIFLQKSGRKCGREASSRPLFVFLKSFI